MAELAADISVHFQFPKNVMLNTKFDCDPTNWQWKKCLIFPVNKLDNRFLSKPYKQMHYATGIVVGARGDLCDSVFGSMHPHRRGATCVAA